MWFPNKALVSFESCHQYENFLKWCESVGITDGYGDPFYVEWQPDLCLRIHGHVIKSFASTAYYRTPGGSGWQRNVSPGFLFCAPEYFMGAVEPQEEFGEADIDWAGLL